MASATSTMPSSSTVADHVQVEDAAGIAEAGLAETVLESSSFSSPAFMVGPSRKTPKCSFMMDGHLGAESA